MRRLTRMLVNCATVMSLVLCIAMAWAWARSYHMEDKLRLVMGGVDWRATSMDGRVTIVPFRRGFLDDEPPAWAARPYTGGFGWGALVPPASWESGPGWQYVTVPHGIPCIAAAVPPAARGLWALWMWAARVRRRRRARRPLPRLRL